MNVIENIARKLLQQAVVIQKQQIAENTFHIRLCGKYLRDISYVPGENLRIFVGMGRPTSLREKVRTYSVWNYDPVEQTIDIAACLHSSGPGSTWARDVKLGDTVYFSGPKGKFTVDQSGDFYIFIGDISALAHLYEIRRNLHPDKKVYGIIYSPEVKDFFVDIDGSAPFEFYKMPLNPTHFLLEQLKEIEPGFAGKGITYIGGDVRICVDMHRYFRKQLQWNSRQVKTKPFWSPHKTGLE